MAEIVLLGDAAEQLRTLPPESVHTCVTSPPYFNLRDYGVAGQIGAEATPEEFVEKLVDVFREVRRILRPDGTLWVNIGDSYATRSGKQPPTNTRNSCGHTEKRTPTGYKYKDLIGVPWLLAFALRADGWYLRQDMLREGVEPKYYAGGCKCAWAFEGCLEKPCANRDGYIDLCHWMPFSELWDKTVKPADRSVYGWEANPWVWVIEFERISEREL